LNEGLPRCGRGGTPGLRQTMGRQRGRPSFFRINRWALQGKARMRQRCELVEPKRIKKITNNFLKSIFLKEFAPGSGRVFIERISFFDWKFLKKAPTIPAWFDRFRRFSWPEFVRWRIGIAKICSRPPATT
jgi:hypothetical protein